MGVLALQPEQPLVDPFPIVVDQRNLTRRVDILLVARDPVTRILGPEAEPIVEAVIVGSPDTIRRYLARYAAEGGANYFVGSFQWGDLTHEEALHSLTLFVSEVMPDFAGTTAAAPV